MNNKLKVSPARTTNQNILTRRSATPKIWPFLGVDSNNELVNSVVSSVELIPERSEPRKAFQPISEVIQSNNKPENLDSFHRVFAPILLTAQLFGILPLSGISKPSPRYLSYQFLSPRTFYTMAIMGMLIFMAALSIMHMVNTLNPAILTSNGGVAAATAGVIFYGNGLLGTIIFWRLAPRWIKLQKRWQLMERQFNRSKQPSPQLQWKFRAIIIMVMIPALIEHIMSIIFNVPTNELPRNGTNPTWKDYLELYVYKSHGFILSTCQYNVPLGIFLFFISKVATFIWNFTDLFVMLISTALAERYKTLNKHLIKSTEVDDANIDWSEFRRNYACLSSLVKRIDDDISVIVLLSFVNNLYFICLQLLNGLFPIGGDMLHYFYFFGSFSFLLGRTIAVTLFAARINDQSKVALAAIYTCPALSFNTETLRLQLQMTTDEVCLTGLRFFSITRNFMLAVAGAIVTYEVVLLQFNVAMKK